MFSRIASLLLIITTAATNILASYSIRFLLEPTPPIPVAFDSQDPDEDHYACIELNTPIHSVVTHIEYITSGHDAIVSTTLYTHPDGCLESDTAWPYKTYATPANGLHKTRVVVDVELPKMQSVEHPFLWFKVRTVDTVLSSSSGVVCDDSGATMSLDTFDGAGVVNNNAEN